MKFKKIAAAVLAAVVLSAFSVQSFGVTGSAALVDEELQPGDVFVDGDLKYTVLEDGSLEVTDFASDDLKETVEELIIPEEVNGKKVTSIGKFAFFEASITSVTIPDSVTKIGDCSFDFCKLLTSVTIPNSVTTMGKTGFYGCKSLTSVKLSDNVTTIGEFAFGGCHSLTSVTIPDSVTTIDNGAFQFCISLTSITISNSVSTIGEFAFNGCESLTTVNYSGTKAEWEAIKIGEQNEYLTNAKIIFTESDTSEPTTSDTSEPADPDLFVKENEVSAEIEVPTEAADIPESDRITSITINPAFNMKNKHDNNVELDLSKITIKAEEIYDEEGLKRAEEALGETIKGNKHYNLLDLTLLYNGKDFSNGYEGLVKVIIPLPNGHRDKNFSCFRLTEVDGKTVKELIPGEQTEDSYIIYLEHFSLYALVADANPDDGEKPNEPEESAPLNPGETDSANGSGDGSDGSGTSGEDQKPTGITLAVAPAVLAAGAAVVLLKKRK